MQGEEMVEIFESLTLKEQQEIIDKFNEWTKDSSIYKSVYGFFLFFKMYQEVKKAKSIREIMEEASIMKQPNMVSKDKQDYVEVARAIEILAYHNKNYLWTGDDAKINEEVRALLSAALYENFDNKEEN